MIDPDISKDWIISCSFWSRHSINNIDNVVVILTYIRDKVHIIINDGVLKLPSVGNMLRSLPTGLGQYYGTCHE